MKKISKLVFLLYLLLLTIFPLGVLIRITPIANVNIYPQDLLVGLIFLITLIFYIKRGSRYKNIFKSIFIFNIVAVISLIINSVWLSGMEFLISFSYLLRLDAYFSLLFLGLFGFNKLQVKILKKMFLISSLSVVIFGFVQFVFYNNLRNLYYLGWDEHLYRMFSTFLDPNFAGLYLALLLIFLTGQFMGYKPNRKYLYPYLVLSGLTLIALILTYSRTAIVSFALAISIMMIYLNKIKIFVIFITILLFGVFYFSNLSVEGMNPFRIASSEARLESMREATQIILQSPIYGIGFNAYRYAQLEKGFRDQKLSELSNADAGTDNSFLFILATTGLIGFISYLYCWLNIVKSTRVLNLVYKASSIAVIVALFTGSFFINALFYMPIMLWVFAYFGLYVLREKASHFHT